MKLSIGQVSKLFDISIDALRHYDKINLLKPEVNKNNGYRYYSFQNLDQLQLILGTKELGISLSDIRETIKSEDINEYKNLMLIQEKLIKDKIENLKKLQRRIDENKKMFDTIIDFKNEYDFSKIPIHKNQYNFYCIDMKNLLAGEFYKTYLTHMNNLTNENKDDSMFRNLESDEEYFYIYEIKDNEKVIENENLVCIKENEFNKIVINKMTKIYDNKIIKKKIDGYTAKVNFYGSIIELQQYLISLNKYFECSKENEIFIKYEFYLPKKIEEEKYFIEILFKLK